jgi:hypothetical protein
MIKNKIWMLTLLLSLGGLVSFTTLNQPSIAMENEDDNIISIITGRLNYYSRKTSELEEDKRNLQEDKRNLQEATQVLQQNLVNTDIIIKYLVEEATPSAMLYLRTLSKENANEEELIKLKEEASKDIYFYDLVSRVSGQIRNNTSVSIKKLVSFYPKIQMVSEEELSSVAYHHRVMPGTPKEDLNTATKVLQTSIERRNYINNNNNDNEKCTPTKTEKKTIKKEDNKVIIQNNNNEIGIPITSLPPFTQPQDLKKLNNN